MAELTDEGVNVLTTALNQLTSQIREMGSSIGRGSNAASGIGDAAQKSALTRATVKSTEEMKKVIAGLSKFKAITDSGIALTKEEKAEREALNKTLEGQTAAVEDSAKAYARTGTAIKDFATQLLNGRASVTTFIPGVLNSLSGFSKTYGTIIGGFAGGVGFMLEALKGFSEDAAKMGGFADLGAFKIGSIQQAKIMSGLGESFIKIIEQSQGGFKSFGNNSQESMEALSELSRGFRVGSNTLSSSMRTSLGPDLVKTMDKAMEATNSMGLSQEDQAAVMGSLTQSIGLTARSSDEARQAMVRQYKDTTESARILSNTFGVSAKDMLKAMEGFRKTSAGKTAALQGLDSEAANAAALIEQMGVKVDDETRARMATSIAQGDYNQARAMVDPNDQQAFALVEATLQKAMAGGGIKGAEGAARIAAGAQEQIPGLEAIFESRKGQQINAEYSSAGQRAGSAAAMMKLQARATAGDEDAKKELAKMAVTTESAGVLAQNKLTDALNSLRTTIIGLTAGFLVLLGPLGAILGAGGLGALATGGAFGKLLGGLGETIGKWGSKASGLISKIPGVGGIAETVGSKAGGLISKIPGVGGIAETVGSWGSKIGGAGSGVGEKIGGIGGKLAPLGDKLGSIAGKGMDTATSGMGKFGEMLGKLGDNKTLKGAGTLALLGGALILAAVGFRTFGEVTWEGMLKGTIALGGLIVLARGIGAASTSMLKGAAAIAILGASLLISAIGFKTFNEVETESLIKGAVALGVLGVAAVLLGKAAPQILLGSLAIAALGAAMWIAGKGFQTFNEVEPESLIKGAVALGVLGVAAVLLGKAAPQIGLGSLAIAALGAAMWIAGKGFQTFNGVDFEQLAKGALALVGFTAAIFALGAIMMSGVGALLFGAGLLAIVALGVAAAITGVALGIAAVGLGMFAGRLEEIAEIDGANLIAVGAGLAAIGFGMIAFTAGMIAGTAGGVISGIMSLFGAKSPLDRIKEFVPIADKIALLGQGIKNFGDGVLDLNQGMTGFDQNAFDNLKTIMQEFAIAGSSEEMRLTAEYLKSIGSSLTDMSEIETLPAAGIPALPGATIREPAAGIPALPGATIREPAADIQALPGATIREPAASIPAFDSSALAENISVDTASKNEPVLTLQMVEAALSYLSSIQNDMAAVRGNTKAHQSDTPVRLT